MAHSVIPAKACIRRVSAICTSSVWTPAFAGVTVGALGVTVGAPGVTVKAPGMVEALGATVEAPGVTVGA